jgi:hypothetical protein
LAAWMSAAFSGETRAIQSLSVKSGVTVPVEARSLCAASLRQICSESQAPHRLIVSALPDPDG